MVITLIDGAIYFLNNKNISKSFFYTINENVPITALKWKSNKKFFLGDTDGKFYEVEYFKKSNEICICEEVIDSYGE